MARRADFVSHGLDDPAPTPEARARNGEYGGALPVRVLLPGVTGADLERAKAIRLRAGQVWRRGHQRVRVTRVTASAVWFTELDHGSARRHVARWFFLRYSIPEQAIGNEGVGQ